MIKGFLFRMNGKHTYLNDTNKTVSYYIKVFNLICILLYKYFLYNIKNVFLHLDSTDTKN